MEELRQNAEPDVVIMLVGNKADLPEANPSSRQVYYDHAAEFARQHGLFFSEASALSGSNVKHVFEHLLQEIFNQANRSRAREPKGEAGGISLGAPQAAPSCC